MCKSKPEENKSFELSDMFNKVSLVSMLETWDLHVFVQHGRQHQRMLCLI